MEITTIQASDIKVALCERAVLVNLSVSAYGGQRMDRQITQDVSTAYGAEDIAVTDSGERYRPIKANKCILQPAVKKVMKAVNSMRQRNYFLTLPWSDTGWRLLPNAMFFQWRQEMQAFETEIRGIVRDITEDYDSYVARDQRALGRAFRLTDYPTAGQFADSYRVDRKIRPVPTAGSWVVDIEREEMMRLREELAQDIEQEFQSASRDLFERVHSEIKSLHKNLVEFGEEIPGTSRTRTFRDTAVDNLRSLAEILPALNVTGDPDLDQLARDIQAKLTRHSAETLREDTKARKATQRDAKAILDAVSAFMG